jgi:LPS export ABC transporter protein LptC
MKLARIGYVLAAACFVAACGEKGKAPPVATKSLSDSADQVLFSVRFFITDHGLMRAEVFGDTMFTYNDNTKSELRRVRSTFFAATGAKNATLTSKWGRYDVRLQTMEARGDVVVVSDSGRKLTTQQLRYDPSRNEITSDSAFVILQPKKRGEGQQTLQGIGFISDPTMSNVRILKGAKASGVTVPVPGS